LARLAGGSDGAGELVLEAHAVQAGQNQRTAQICSIRPRTSPRAYCGNEPEIACRPRQLEIGVVMSEWLEVMSGAPGRTAASIRLPRRVHRPAPVADLAFHNQ
jgi:hypothetical protein